MCRITKDTHVNATAGAVTLYDLVAWDPTITSTAGYDQLATREVDWVLTARASQPMLPLLRGGELIILPNRIVREIGVPFAQLVREISTQPIAGVLTDAEPADVESSVVVLHTATLTADTEATLNRLLATGRRQAQNAIAELDQVIAEAAARQVRPSELMDQLSQRLQLPITIHTGGGTVLFTTGSSRDEPDPATGAWLDAPLRAGYTLWLGPIPPARHALARFATHHVRDALQRSLDSTAESAPRGSARSAALNNLIHQPANDPDRLAQDALAAGVPAGVPLRVAHSLDVPAAIVRKSLGHLGDVLDAGSDGQQELWLIVERADRKLPRYDSALGEGWIALSEPVDNATDLPHASRQAQYLAIALAREVLAPGTVEFGPQAGVLQLLFAGWGSAEQRQYRDAHLAPLLDNDPRGQLLETLSAYLDHQAAQGPTADFLGIHRNTLAYRFKHIEALLPRELSDPHYRLTLHMAITIHRLFPL